MKSNLFTQATIRTLLAVFLSVAFPLTEIQAQKIDKSKLENAAKRSRAAGQVLTTVVQQAGDTIPHELIDRAKAIGVFPELDRISFLLPKSRLAYGVIASRRPDGWSPPAYYGFGAPKLDLTWKGDKKPDIIILFMTDKAIAEFEQGNFRFKDEMVGFAGPIGALTNQKESTVSAANVIIYAFVDGKVEGLRVDANELGGGAANPDNNINSAIYGLKGRDILLGKTPLWPSVLPTVAEYQNVLIILSKKVS